jgi:hypothetical protein
VSRRTLGWIAAIGALGTIALLGWPVLSGQEALWAVTVGSNQTGFVQVGSRVIPLRLLFDGADAMPPGLRTRLAIAAILGVGSAVAAIAWWRKRPA